MSRLDRHVAAVQTKLWAGIFLQTLGRVTLALAALVLLDIVVEHVVGHALPRRGLVLLAAAGLSVAGSMVHAFVRRPTAHAAATAIDGKLGLKEKFSTALYVRPSTDPFAAAAVRDAEQAAENVSLARQFPIRVPRTFGATALLLLAAFLTAQFMPTMNLFASKTDPKKPAVQVARTDPEKQFVKEQTPTFAAAAKVLGDSDAIKKAKADLDNVLHAPTNDPQQSKRSALMALQGLKDALKQEAATNEKVQTAESEKRILNDLENPKNADTPMGQAHQAIKNGDMEKASDAIAKAVNDFDKLPPEEQKKVVEQAQALANQLANAANDPKAGQQIASKLMQMGANQAQAQQMAAAMQRAAAGDKAAQQQLQQMAQKMQQQMNNGQGPTQQQQQQIKQMMAQMQGMANSQQQAGALSKQVQQMAGAMQQAQQAKQAGAGQQNPQAQQQLADAKAQVQQQLQQMDATQKDAQQVKAAQQAAEQGSAQAANGLGKDGGQGDAKPGPGHGQGGGQPDQQAGANPGQGQGQGQGNANPGRQQGQGGQGQGQPGGHNDSIAVAPGQFKSEFVPTSEDEKGKILASRFVKAGIDPGRSKAALQQVAASAEKDAAEDVDQDRISKEAQQSVKDYFGGIQNAGK